MALNSELKTIFESLCDEHRKNLNNTNIKATTVVSGNLKIGETSSIDIVTYSLINDNFTFNITFSDGDGRLQYEKNVLDCHILFTKNNSELMFTLYDVLKIIDKGNFKCYTIYNVNSKDRLNDCFFYLVNEYISFLDKINNLVQDDTTLNGLFKEKCYELQSFFGPNIFNAHEIKKLPDYSKEHFYSTRYSKFNDKAYNYYLDGNFKKALALFKKRTRINEYEYALLNHLRSYANMQAYKTGKQEYVVLPSNLRYKNEPVKPQYQVKNKPLYAFVLPILMFSCAFVYTLLYKFFEYISYRGSYIKIGDKIATVLTIIVPAVFTAFSISTYVKQNMLVKDDSLPLELRTKLGNLIDAETIKKHRRRSVTTMLIVSIICLALGANNSLAFYDVGFKDSTTHITLKNDFYLYSEIETLYVVKDKNVIIKLKKDDKLNFMEYDELTSSNLDKLKEICKDNNIELKSVDSVSDAK